ncbi:cation diffusion facilitator family transporter [Pigmentibacter sp. JX0631]|uniref:cation diffusion facilitator family transporter n=1 Tax=Pigmentibacter sp. JX0631 TaxID=2976982 RepID=UPI002468509D|nr:cation diffusion facilitator family transporter [Pigmentibacter sp. JX0631]WGL59380.1 cation diffusion facilitator family transporter [Pigmentibacter sp. JX0631]
MFPKKNTTFHEGPHHSHVSKEKPLFFALVLTGLFFCIELFAGLISGSLALISDAAHMLTDVIGIAIAYISIKIAKKPADLKRTFGYYRFEILASSFNSFLLIFVGIYILYESFNRFFNHDAFEIKTGIMFWVAIAGLVVNIICMKILSAGKEHSLNLKGAYLEVFSDMISSVGVILAAIIIHFTNIKWVDSLIAILIALWIFPRAWSLLTDSFNILLEGVPKGTDIEGIKKEIKEIHGITDVHDLHVWAITSGKINFTCHIVNRENSNSEELLFQIKKLLAEKHKITHVTIQFESVSCDQEEKH